MNDQQGVSPEELAEEDRMAKSSEAKEEEVRAQIVQQYGLDQLEQSELIDKLTADRLADMKNFGKLVEQKRKWRDKAAKPVETPAPKPNETKPVTETDIDARVNARLEERDLASLALPEDLKEKVRKVAQVSGISVREAAKDPYIVSLVEQHEAKQKADEAAIRRTNQTAATNTTFSREQPPTVDMSTEEGRKVWTSYREWLKTNG